MVEQMLEQEMEEHLGYKKHEKSGKSAGNSRNGTFSKNITTSYGPVEIEIPRDRTGDFEPQVVKKRKTTITDFVRSACLKFIF